MKVIRVEVSVGPLDRHGEVAGLRFDGTDVGVEMPDPDDAVPVADVAVVEDEVVRRRVVADVADIWVWSWRGAQWGCSSAVR